VGSSVKSVDVFHIALTKGANVLIKQKYT